jgi:hypothetical protein
MGFLIRLLNDENTRVHSLNSEDGDGTPAWRDQYTTIVRSKTA